MEAIQDKMIRYFIVSLFLAFAPVSAQAGKGSQSAPSAMIAHCEIGVAGQADLFRQERMDRRIQGRSKGVRPERLHALGTDIRGRNVIRRQAEELDGMELSRHPAMRIRKNGGDAVSFVAGPLSHARIAFDFTTPFPVSFEHPGADVPRLAPARVRKSERKITFSDKGRRYPFMAMMPDTSSEFMSSAVPGTATTSEIR